MSLPANEVFDRSKLLISIKDLLNEHGLNSSIYDDWVVVNNSLPALRAHAQTSSKTESGLSVLLDVELRLTSKKSIHESFAGLGNDEISALNDALVNFCTSSLHVFLSTFWGYKDHDHVTIENWNINNFEWKAHIGNYVRRAFGGEDIPIPEGLFFATEKAIKSLKLEQDIYWFRTFYCNISCKEKVSEALLNNETWESLQNTLLKLDWPQSDKYYSIRNFLILVKGQ